MGQDSTSGIAKIFIPFIMTATFWSGTLIAIDLIALGNIRQGIESYQLGDNYEVARGNVIGKTLFTRKNEYAFKYEGEYYRGTTYKSRRMEDFDIAYLPDKPNVNRPVSSLSMDRYAMWFGILFGPAIAIYGSMKKAIKG